MPTSPTPRPVGSDHPKKVVSIGNNAHDAQLLAGQFDCQIVVQPRPEQDWLPFRETSKRPDALAFQTSERSERFRHQNVSDVSL